MCKIKRRRYFWRECLWLGRRVTAGRSLSGKTPRRERLATLTLCRCRAPEFSPGTLTNIAIITGSSDFLNRVGHSLNHQSTGVIVIPSDLHAREEESARPCGSRHVAAQTPSLAIYDHVHNRSPSPCFGPVTLVCDRHRFWPPNSTTLPPNDGKGTATINHEISPISAVRKQLYLRVSHREFHTTTKHLSGTWYFQHKWKLQGTHVGWLSGHYGRLRLKTRASPRVLGSLFKHPLYRRMI